MLLYFGAAGIQEVPQLTTSSVGLVLWTTDIAGLASFLVNAAGAVLTAQHPGFARVSLGDTSIGLQADEASPGHPWFDALVSDGITRGVGIELRLQVPDVVAAHAIAEAQGAVTVLEPFDTEETRECQVMGPDGYLFTLWQPAASDLPPIGPPRRRSTFGRMPTSRNTTVRRW